MWKQPVYKAHLDGAERRVNRGGGRLKTQSSNTASMFQKKKTSLSGISSLWILPRAVLLPSGSESRLVQSVCIFVCVCDTEVKTIDRDNKQ